MIGTIAASRSRLKRATYFDGVSAGLVKSSPSFSGDTSGAIYGRVYLPALLADNGDVRLFCLRMATGTDNSFVIVDFCRVNVLGTGTFFRVRGRATHNGTSWAGIHPDAVTAAGWHTFCCGVSGGSPYLSFDGVAKTPTTQSPLAAWGGEWMAIGASGTREWFIGGGGTVAAITYGETRQSGLTYASTIPSGADLTRHATNFRCDPRSFANAADIISYWPLDGVYTDIKGSNHLTATGSPTIVMP